MKKAILTLKYELKYEDDEDTPTELEDYEDTFFQSDVVISDLDLVHVEIVEDL